MSQHTPGPWFSHNLWLGPEGKGPFAFPLGTDEDQAAANARLIAAAPDLLAALEAATACLARAPDAYPLLKQAEIAIAKARGTP